jgi:hypothetical protein
VFLDPIRHVSAPSGASAFIQNGGMGIHYNNVSDILRSYLIKNISVKPVLPFLFLKLNRFFFRTIPLQADQKIRE